MDRQTTVVQWQGGDVGRFVLGYHPVASGCGPTAGAEGDHSWLQQRRPLQLVKRLLESRGLTLEDDFARACLLLSLSILTRRVAGEAHVSSADRHGQAI